MGITLASVEVAYLFLSFVSGCPNFTWSQLVHISRVNSKVFLFFQVRDLEIKSIEPQLLIWQIIVFLSTCKKRKNFQYPATVYRPRKKLKMCV